MTIKGFDLLSWIAEDRKNRKKMTSMLEQMAKLVNAGKLRVSMEEMPLDQWFDALAGTEPGMNTKVVLKMLSMEGERMREMEKQAAVEKAKRHEEEKREALRVAARELFLGPPLDVEAVATAQCYEISAKAGFRGTLIWVHGNGELPQEYTSMFDRAFLSQLSHVKVVMPTPAPDRARVSDPQLWFDLDEAAWRARYLQGGDMKRPERAV